MKQGTFKKTFFKDDFLSVENHLFLTLYTRTYVPNAKKGHFFHYKVPKFIFGNVFSW